MEGPASKRCTMRMIVTPVRSYPSRIAAWIGAAPRSPACPRRAPALQVLVAVVLRYLLGRQASHEVGIAVLLLRPFRHCRPALEHAQVVDEQLAVQMVDLVLEAARQQLRRLDLD